jgi:Cu+-exporting ATPase
MLKSQSGIVSVQVALLAERGVVEYDEGFVADDGSRWDPARIAEEIEDCGFEAQVVQRGQSQSVELRVYG